MVHFISQQEAKRNQIKGDHKSIFKNVGGKQSSAENYVKAIFWQCSLHCWISRAILSVSLNGLNSTRMGCLQEMGEEGEVDSAIPVWEWVWETGEEGEVVDSAIPVWEWVWETGEEGEVVDSAIPVWKWVQEVAASAIPVRGWGQEMGEEGQVVDSAIPVWEWMQEGRRGSDRLSHTVIGMGAGNGVRGWGCSLCHTSMGVGAGGGRLSYGYRNGRSRWGKRGKW